MQRINWFTNPNLTGPLTGISKWGGVTASVNKTNHQLVVSGSNGGYGFNVDVPANTPLVVSMFVYTDITKQSTPVAIMDVDDAGKVTVLASVKPKSNASTMVTRVTSKTGKIRFEAYPVSGTTVNFGDLLVERADTYDKAVGGGFRASSRGIRCHAPNPRTGGGGMTPIINHCVMPKDGVSVKTTNTTPSDITFTGLTAGVKYHASVVCYMLSTSGDNPRLRLTTNSSDSGLVTSNGRVDYVFTAASTTHGILVGLNNCTVNLSKGLCVPQDQWQQLVSLGLPGNYFDGDTMPKD